MCQSSPEARAEASGEARGPKHPQDFFEPLPALGYSWIRGGVRDEKDERA